MSISDNEAIGVGLFGTNSVRMQFTDAGVGVPRLDAFDQLDVILPVTGAFGIPNSPLAVGATADDRRFAQRRDTTAKAVDLTAIRVRAPQGS